MKKIFLSGCLAFCLISTLQAAGLTPIETQMRDYIVQQNKQQMVLLTQLVNINSGTTNSAGVIKVGKIVRNELNQLGFKTRWAVEPKDMHRAPTLIAERVSKKNKSKRLLLIGHLDTVFPADSSFQRVELRKNTVKGPGTSDDKGGVVVMLYALKALQAAHVLDDTNITIVLTGDEEDSGKPTAISRLPLKEAAQHAEVALDFEPSVNLDTGTIARRGIGAWIIETQGNESHSATIFQKEVGAGAIFELARILNTMRTELSNQKEVTFNPGMILGGTSITYDTKTAIGTAFGKTNVVSKIAIVKGDYRFLSADQKQSLEAKITAIVKNNLPETKASVTFQQGIPPMAPTEANLKLLKTYSSISEDLGLGSIKPLPPGMRGAGDISHIAAMVPANLAGLGPLGWGAHSVIESAELNSFPIQTERAAVLIYRLTH